MGLRSATHDLMVQSRGKEPYWRHGKNNNGTKKEANVSLEWGVEESSLAAKKERESTLVEEDRNRKTPPSLPQRPSPRVHQVHNQSKQVHCIFAREFGRLFRTRSALLGSKRRGGLRGKTIFKGDLANPSWEGIGCSNRPENKRICKKNTRDLSKGREGGVKSLIVYRSSAKWFKV